MRRPPQKRSVPIVPKPCRTDYMLRHCRRQRTSKRSNSYVICRPDVYCLCSWLPARDSEDSKLHVLEQTLDPNGPLGVGQFEVSERSDCRHCILASFRVGAFGDWHRGPSASSFFIGSAQHCWSFWWLCASMHNFWVYYRYRDSYFTSFPLQ